MTAFTQQKDTQPRVFLLCHVNTMDQRVQFPPAGGTVCEADRTRTNKEKTRQSVSFLYCVFRTLWINYQIGKTKS